MWNTIVVGKPSDEMFVEFFKRMIDRRLENERLRVGSGNGADTVQQEEGE
jgi:hypothetical protein